MFYTDTDQALFFFIKVPKDEAVQRFVAAFDLSEEDLTDNDQILQYEVGRVGGWIGFVDYMAEDEWHLNRPDLAAQLAQTADAVYAYYSTDFCGGALTVMRDGKTIREIINYPEDDELSDENKNEGTLEYEKETPIANWLDIIDFINHLLKEDR